MLLATFFFSLMNICVKFLPRIPAYELAAFRSMGIIILTLGAMRYQKVSIQINHRKYVLLRGIFGTLGLLMYFYTLQNIPLATAVILQYLSPIFGTILAIFILKEYPTVAQWCFFGLSFTGVLLIKGFDTRISIYFLLTGIGSALFSGLAYNYIRKLKEHDHPLMVVLSFAVISLVILLPYTLFNWVTPIGMDWLYLILLGGCTQLSQLYMTKAYQAEEISIVSNFNYVGAVFAIILGFTVFGEHIPLLSLVGIVLVITGVILGSLSRFR